MGSSRFERALAVRLVVAFACVAASAWMFGATHLRVIPVVLLVAAAWQAVALARAVRRGAARITAALAAWRTGELGDGARTDAMLSDTGFAGLGAALDDVTRHLREAHAHAEEQRLYLEAIAGHAPVPLFVLDGRRIDFANHAARRLFGGAVASLDDLSAFGDALARDIVALAPGERRLTRMTADGASRRLLLGAGSFRARGSERRLIAVESIESELEGRTLEAWVDMARVLAHEIMGSLTPVASLTSTAAQVLGELEAPDPRIAQAREAVATAARRSDGLMTFVRRYRELSSLPAPELAVVDLVELVRGVAALLAAELAAAGTALTVEAVPGTLPVRGDRSLLEQALINLVRNAADAVRGRESASIWLAVRVTAGGRTAVEVADNGPGVPPALVETIFVPFFSTKRGGSGIGLTIAQHVAHSHGGTLRVGDRPGGGAAFTLFLGV